MPGWKLRCTGLLIIAPRIWVNEVLDDPSPDGSDTNSKYTILGFRLKETDALVASRIKADL